MDKDGDNTVITLDMSPVDHFSNTKDCLAKLKKLEGNMVELDRLFQKDLNLNHGNSNSDTTRQSATFERVQTVVAKNACAIIRKVDIDTTRDVYTVEYKLINNAHGDSVITAIKDGKVIRATARGAADILSASPRIHDYQYFSSIDISVDDNE